MRRWQTTTTAFSASGAMPTRTRSRRPTGGWPGSCIPTSTLTRRPRSGSRRSPRPTRCCPTRASGRCTTWAPTRSRRPGAARPRRVRGRVPVQRHHGRVLRGRGRSSRAAEPGPARPQRDHPGRARPVRVRVRHHQGSGGGHRGGLPDLLRRGHGAGHPPGDLRHLQRPGRGEPGHPLVPGPGHDVPAVPGLRRIRHGDPPPVPGVRCRRPGQDPSHDQGADPGRRRGRHAHPAGRRGRDRPGRRPAG